MKKNYLISMIVVYFFAFSFDLLAMNQKQQLELRPFSKKIFESIIVQNPTISTIVSNLKHHCVLGIRGLKVLIAQYICKENREGNASDVDGELNEDSRWVPYDGSKDCVTYKTLTCASAHSEKYFYPVNYLIFSADNTALTAYLKGMNQSERGTVSWNILDGINTKMGTVYDSDFYTTGKSCLWRNQYDRGEGDIFTVSSDGAMRAVVKRKNSFNPKKETVLEKHTQRDMGTNIIKGTKNNVVVSAKEAQTLKIDIQVNVQMLLKAVLLQCIDVPMVEGHSSIESVEQMERYGSVQQGYKSSCVIQ